MNTTYTITILRDGYFLLYIVNLYMGIVAGIFTIGRLFKKDIKIFSWSYLLRIIIASSYIIAIYMSVTLTYKNQKKQKEYSKAFIISTLKVEIEENMMIIDKCFGPIEKELEVLNNNHKLNFNPKHLNITGWEKIKIDVSIILTKEYFKDIVEIYDCVYFFNTMLETRELELNKQSPNIVNLIEIDRKIKMYLPFPREKLVLLDSILDKK